MAQLLVHVMDALLQRGTLTVPAARCLMQVQVEILEHDHVLNQRSTGLSRKSGGLIWDSKFKLELPHIADVREAAERLSVRFSLMTESEQQSKLMITVASVLVPLSTLGKRGDVCQRREHILALKSSLGGEEVLARLRLGSLLANADMQTAIDEFLEKAPSSTSVFLATRQSSAEQELSSDSGTDYAKRAEAGNQVLLDLQSLAERLDAKEVQGPHAGELIVPMLVLIEFLRTRVSREAAREVESKHNSSHLVTPRVVIPPDVSMLFDGGLSTTMPALLLSSVAVFVARRLRVSTGATASAESAELKIAVRNVESDLEGIAKETTELQLFFAKSTSANAKQQGDQSSNDFTLLRELDIIPFRLTVEQKLSELESCIEAEWGSAKKASSDQKQLVAFFLVQLSTLSDAVEIKADEVMSKVNRAHDTGFTLTNPDAQDFYHIKSLREFRMRIKKSEKKMLSAGSIDPAEEFSEEVEHTTHSQLPIQRDSNSPVELLDRLSCAFSKRIFDRSLAAFQTLMVRTLKNLPEDTDASSQMTAQLSQLASPRREEYSKVVGAARKLSLSFRAIAAFVEDKSAEPSVDSSMTSDPLAEICKVVRLCLDKNSDHLPSLAKKCSTFLDLFAQVPKSDISVPTQATPSFAGNVATAARLCDILDRHFMHGVDGGSEGATIWSSSVRDTLLILFLWPVVSHTADDVSEVFSAMIECGDDGVSLMLAAWMLATPENRDIFAPVQFCGLLARLFGGSQSPSAGTQEVKAELENELLSKALHLIKRCKTKFPLTEHEILAILDSDSKLEATKDYVHQRTLLHLGSDAQDIDSLLIDILIRRAKINIEQLDQFGRTAVELAAARGRSDLLSLFIRRGRSGRTVAVEARKGKGGKNRDYKIVAGRQITGN